MVRILRETARWNARDVRYWAGSVEDILELIPVFTKEDFRTDGSSPANPQLDVVVRLSRPVFSGDQCG